MAKSAKRRQRQRLRRLKKIETMPWKGVRQEMARPVQVIAPKKGGRYDRQKWKRGDNRQRNFRPCCLSNKGNNYRGYFFLRACSLNYKL